MKQTSCAAQTKVSGRGIGSDEWTYSPWIFTKLYLRGVSAWLWSFQGQRGSHRGSVTALCYRREAKSSERYYSVFVCLAWNTQVFSFLHSHLVRLRFKVARVCRVFLVGGSRRSRASQSDRMASACLHTAGLDPKPSAAADLVTVNNMDPADF